MRTCVRRQRHPPAGLPSTSCDVTPVYVAVYAHVVYLACYSAVAVACFAKVTNLTMQLSNLSLPMLILWIPALSADLPHLAEGRSKRLAF